MFFLYGIYNDCILLANLLLNKLIGHIYYSTYLYFNYDILIFTTNNMKMFCTTF